MSDKRRSDKTVSGKSSKFFGRVFAFLGRFLILLGKAMCIGLLDIAAVFLIACACVPVSIVYVSTMLGMSVENSLMDLIFVFGAPCLFILAMWVVFAVWFLKTLNGYIRSLFDKISAIGGMKSDKSGDCD